MVLRSACALSHPRFGTDARFVEMLASQAQAIEKELLRLQAENASMRTTLEYVERWANHHGAKPHITAEQALGCIQHHPDIHDITKGYADGKRPNTFDPYARIAELERQLVAEARAAAEQKLRADQLAQQHRMQAQMHAQATQQLAALEARKPLPLSDAEIIAAQESLALSRARIGLPCSRCEPGKYRADSNAYHDFHRCDSCMHVPMWGEDGKEIGPPTCAGELS